MTDADLAIWKRFAGVGRLGLVAGVAASKAFDGLDRMIAEVDRLRSNFEWLDKFERDHGELNRYIEFRQRSQEIGVLAAIDEFRGEEGDEAIWPTTASPSTPTSG